ncbi:isochorismate synthase [Actinoplanes lutulentus]|uniref:isochorismate synthase n=1 Tax=Actinoplanes lutulentus TaxID=1287878 RepID=A0A327ZIU0_9ACTN|nr:isochorismate synthase [Actinoplanes lutulentus]MBB2942552.1 isochorismate synthase [Actinoplanes lutulentus]RAK38133.1 isochorismate synthase [Actinoplanes lutulentus]
MSAVSSTLDGAGLLAAYRPGASSVFASPRGTLLAEGARAVATTVPEAESLLRAGARIVLGAAPFTLNSPAHPARLVVPVNLRRAEAVGARAAAPAARPVVPAIPDDAYLAAVARAVADIGAGAYTKVVLARTLRIAAPGFDPAPVVRALAAAGSYTFGVDLGAGRTLLGASPELLVSRFGRTVSANPLAGSIPRSLDPAEDARRAAALLASAKDLREHAFASEAVAEGLRPFCRDLRVPSEPALTATPTMWHLGSRITGEIADPGVSALALAAALHPTPAVCGTPPAAARRAIAELETFDRGFFAGMVGWTSADGDGEWAVTIRCATAGPDGLDVYAGAGIVSGSDPQAELAETNAKLGTMLSALGVTDVA